MDEAHEEFPYSQKAPARIFFLPHVKEEETWSKKTASSEARGRSATDGSQARTSLLELPQLPSAHASARSCHAVGAPLFAPASPIQRIGKTTGMIKFLLRSILLL